MKGTVTVTVTTVYSYSYSYTFPKRLHEREEVWFARRPLEQRHVLRGIHVDGPLVVGGFNAFEVAMERHAGGRSGDGGRGDRYKHVELAVIPVRRIELFRRGQQGERCAGVQLQFVHDVDDVTGRGFCGGVKVQERRNVRCGQADEEMVLGAAVVRGAWLPCLL